MEIAFFQPDEPLCMERVVGLKEGDFHELSYVREGVGVEPTAAGSAPPATGFEDRGIHRDTCLPMRYYSACVRFRQICGIVSLVVEIENGLVT